jgi:hypothetical protein
MHLGDFCYILSPVRDRRKATLQGFCTIEDWIDNVQDTRTYDSKQ